MVSLDRLESRVTRRQALELGAAGALGLYLVGCGGGDEEGARPGAVTEVDVGEVGEDPIIIGLVLGITGPNSVIAPSSIQATQLAVEEVNANGGVLGGRKIQLVLGDDGTDPRIARQAWESVITQQNAVAVIALETSANRNAGVPVGEQTNTPAIYTSQYEGGACSPILYTNAEVPNQQIDPEVAYLTEEKGVDKFFLVGSDYVFPRKSFEVAKPLITNAGATVVGEEYAPIGTTDWSAVVGKIQGTNPGAVYAITVAGSDPVAFMKQLRASGSEAIVAGTTIEENGLKALGPDGEGLLMAAAYFQALETPESQKYVSALQDRFEDFEPQNLYSTPCYDALHQFAAAMDMAGSTETAPVLEALAEVSVTGPRGEVKMNTDRHATLPVYLAEGQADGAFRIIKDFGPVEAADQCDPDPPFGMES